MSNLLTIMLQLVAVLAIILEGSKLGNFQIEGGDFTPKTGIEYGEWRTDVFNWILSGSGIGNL